MLNPWCASDGFYLELIMKAQSVLDVGCGTGALLKRARSEGHKGRLCGVDPDPAMLEVARRHSEIEWVQCTAADIDGRAEFELATMTGHAFQNLVTDSEVRESLASIRAALAPRGRFAFETRNPDVREWESWNPDNSFEAVDPQGRPVRMSYEVESVKGDVVALSETTTVSDGRMRVDRASLRFLDKVTLSTFLTEAGFAIEAQYGDWEKGPLLPSSPEIITVARRP